MSDPKLLNRLKKLFALAENNSDVNEAALALQMAQKLMSEHNLTRAEIDVGAIHENAVRSVATASKSKLWELCLYRGIADAFGCELMFCRGLKDWAFNTERYAQYVFVGTETEVALAVYAATVLQRQIIRARTAYTAKLVGYSRQGKTAELDAYCLGWATSALSKVSRLAPNAAREAAVKSYLTRRVGVNGTRPTVSSSHSGASYESHQQGVADGAAAELNRPVEGAEVAEQGSLPGAQRALPAHS